MGALRNFAFEEHLVRVVDRDGEPWFVGVDVCRALQLAKPENALGSLDDDEKYTLTEGVIGEGAGRSARIVVSEAGVYRLVFRSRKPEAERFKRWIAHDVLPAIRRTGRYGPAAEPLPSLDNSAVAVWRTKIDLVREARIQFGPARARLLWAELGLPPVPELPPAPPRDDGPDALRRLLGTPWRGRALADLVAGGDRDAMLAFGVRVTVEPPGLFVSNTGAGVLSAFAETAWADGSWRGALLSLAGARKQGTVRFGADNARAIWLPAALFD